MKFLLIILTITAISCGTDNGGSGDTSTVSEQDESVILNETYTTIFAATVSTCTGGVSVDIPEEGANINVEYQDDNTVVIYDQRATSEDHYYNGVTVGFNFSGTQDYRYIDPDLGIIRRYSTIRGIFSSEGTWSGTVTTRISFVDLGEVCDISIPFEGVLVE